MDRVGDYELLELIGTGGMGEVYRARHAHLGRIVALKMLRAGHGGDPDATLRFFREIQLSIGLRHPSLVRVFDCGTADGVLFLAMECLEGESLEQLLTARGALPVQEALSIALGIASGLEALHGSRILHRDLKPSNVFLEPDGVKLIDFGVSFQLDRTRLTVADGVMGTLEYMAPELVLGGAPGPSGDVWALGCIFYRMLTGRIHVSPNSAGGWLGAILGDPIRPPQELDANIPTPVSELAVRLLTRDSGERPTSAELVRELEQLVEPGVGRCSFPDRKTAQLNREITRVMTRQGTRPGTGRWLRRWIYVAGLVVLVAFALSPTWMPEKVNLPVANTKVVKKPPLHRSQLWLSYVKYLPVLRGKSLQAKRAAIQELRTVSPLPMGRKPELWLFWLELGQWLDDVEEDPKSKPPSRANTDMDGLEFNIFRSRLNDFDLLSLQQRVDLAIRLVVENPGDGLTWLVLGCQLQQEGRAAAARACYQTAFARTKKQVWHAYPAAVWDALYQALACLPGHSLEHEWVDWVLPADRDLLPWERLLEYLKVRPSEAWQKLLGPYLRNPILGAGASWILGRLYLVILLDRNRALEIWQAALKDDPRSVVLNEAVLRYYLSRGDLKNALPIRSRLTMDGERFFVNQLPDPGEYSVIIQLWEQESVLRMEYAFWLERHGRWSHVRRRLDALGAKAELIGWGSIGPIYELLGRDQGTDVLVDCAINQLKKYCNYAGDCEFLGGPVWDLYFGALATPAGEPIFARILDEIDQRWPGTNMPSLLRIAQMGRAGHTVAALDGLDQARVRPSTGSPLLLQRVASEVLTRAVVHNELRPTPDGAFRERIRKLGEVTLTGAHLAYWRSLMNGQYKAASAVAESLLDQHAGYVEWPLCGMWASALAGDTAGMDFWRGRLHALVGFHCCGLWALKEAEDLAGKKMSGR